MNGDIVERAEAVLAKPDRVAYRVQDAWERADLVPELVAELKAARAKNDQDLVDFTKNYIHLHEQLEAARGAESDDPYPTQEQLNAEDAQDLQRIIDWLHANGMAEKWLAGEQPVDYIIRLLTEQKEFVEELTTSDE